MSLQREFGSVVDVVGMEASRTGVRVMGRVDETALTPAHSIANVTSVGTEYNGSCGGGNSMEHGHSSI